MRWWLVLGLVALLVLPGQVTARAQSEPGLFTQTLPNGMLAVVREVPSSRLAAINVGVRGGARDEDPATLGAAHFMEHMYFQGTPRRPNLGDFDYAIESLGGFNNAWTNTESINFQIEVPAEGFDVGLDIMADLIVNSTFPADRLEKERRVVIEELNQSLNNPSEYIWEVFLTEVFKGHPLEHQPGGDRTTVGRVTRDVILRFRDTYFVANNMVVAVVGNVRHEEVFPKLTAQFADLRQGPRPAFKAAPPPEAKGRRIDLPYAAQQSQVALGFPTAGYDSPDRYALEVANAVLGGVGARLFTEIVDREGLASTAGSFYSPNSDVGVWAAIASTDPASVDDVIEVMRAQLQRLIDEPLSETELAEARNSLAGSRQLAQESIANQAADLSDGLALGYYQPVDDYIAHITAVSAAEVQLAARRYLDPDTALVVVLGP